MATFTQNFDDFFRQLLPAVLRNTRVAKLLEVVFDSISMFVSSFQAFYDDVIEQAQIAPTDQKIKNYLDAKGYSVTITDGDDFSTQLFRKDFAGVALVPHLVEKGATGEYAKLKKFTLMKKSFGTFFAVIQTTPVVTAEHKRKVLKSRPAGITYIFREE